jgi:hypothetical protein
MRPTTRRTISSGLAVALSLIVVGSAVAITWSTTKRLTPTTNAAMWAGSLGASGSTLHLVHRQLVPGDRTVVYRRSTDGGATWKPPVEVSRPAATVSSRASLSVSGSVVDVVWVEIPTTGPQRLYHRRATGGGATWGPPRAISPTTTTEIGLPTVASSGSTVVVAYTDWVTGDVWSRRSSDGGATWGARFRLGTTTQDHFGNGSALEATPDLAFGTGVLYAAWAPTMTKIAVRRSFDGGVTWSATTTLDSSAYLGRARIATAGSSAMIIYEYWDGVTNGYVVQRRTSDKGANWAARARVSTGTPHAWPADLIRAGGAWRVVYQQCLAVACDTGTGLSYLDSTTGTTWTAASRFSNHGTRPDQSGASLASTSDGRTWVGWSGFALDAVDGDVYVRSGQ